MARLSFSLLAPLLLQLAATVVSVPHRSLSVSIDLDDDYTSGPNQHAKVAPIFHPNEEEKLVRKTYSFDHLNTMQPPGLERDDPCYFDRGMVVGLSDEFKKSVDVQGHKKAYVTLVPESTVLRFKQVVFNISVTFGRPSDNGLAAVKSSAIATYWPRDSDTVAEKVFNSTGIRDHWIETGKAFSGLDEVARIELTTFEKDAPIMILKVEYDVWEWVAASKSPSMQKSLPGFNWGL